MVHLWRLMMVSVVSLLPVRTLAEPAGERFEYLDNGLIRIGACIDRGGSIGSIADSKKGENIVNIHDLGRWIGQSYYCGPKPFGEAHPAWKNWPWNPVSAGDVYLNPSKLVELKNDGKTLYVKSVPMQWALKNVPGDCTFETWITLDGRCARVRNRLTNAREDRKQYPAMHQELPAVYTIGTLHRLVSYTGDAPFTDAAVTEIPKTPPKDGKPQWSTFFATEHWAALIDENDWGLGVIHPGAVRFLGGFHGRKTAGGPKDDPCGYISPVRHEILDHNVAYEYSYTLALDSLKNIRAQAIKERPATVPDYRFIKDRQHCWYQNMTDAGWPIEGRLKLRVEQNDPHLMGPEGAWEAKDAPVIYIRAAYRTKSDVAELFFETADKPGFPADQVVRFKVQPDGQIRTYAVKMTDCAKYRGMIRRLRFDPVPSGGEGEVVEVEYISAKGE